MKTKVGQIQINNSFSGQNYFPYSVGLLQAYAEKHLKNPDDFEFLLPIYSRLKVNKALELLENVDIALFSTYVWNINLSLKIAEELKKKNPKVVIVFGGPHVPDNAEEFLKKHPFIDIGCHKEGEGIICPLLENAFDEQKWKDIPSISYYDKEGVFRKTEMATRIKDLDEIPSPYLEGAFDGLIEAYPEERWLVMWETNRGCPFSCTFCDWGSATQAKVNKFGLERLYKEVDWITEHKIEFVFCCDANYGMLPRDFDIVEYIAKNKEELGYPHAFSVQNTKNARERAYKVQKALSDFGLNKGVTLSMQSVDPTTLENVKRQNISLDTYQDLQHRFTKDRIETYSDMILGMPGETYDSFVNGISTIIANGQHNRIQFGNLSILPNAEMGNPDYQKKFGMEIIESDIINIHGSLIDEEEIQERQELVVATDSMPREDWVKTRAICWTSAFLHFDKVLQIPFTILHKLGNGDVTYREMIEAFASNKIEKYPLLKEINEFFLETAVKIQNGEAEYCESKKWLNIWWPADELQLIHLCTEDKLDLFYEQAHSLINEIIQEKGIQIDEKLLKEAIHLNHLLIKKPFNTEDLEAWYSYDIWDIYQHLIVGEEVSMSPKKVGYLIDRTTLKWGSWDQWCQEVIWYGNKKGAYLYGIKEYLAGSESETVPEEEAELVGAASNKIPGHH